MPSKAAIMLLFAFIILPFAVPETKGDHVEEARRIFQAADTNKDYILSLEEAKNFGRKYTDLLPTLYGIKPASKKGKENIDILMENIFKLIDTDGNGLSFRGTLTERSEASVYGEGAYKTIANYFHDIQDLPKPFAVPAAPDSGKVSRPASPVAALN